MIDFAPRPLAAEVLQNVRTILATQRGSVPLDRAFGISWEHLDAPLPEAKMRMMADVIDAVRAYEPRAVIEQVDITADTGAALEVALRVRVRFSLEEGSADDGGGSSGAGEQTADVSIARVIAAQAARTAAQIAALQVSVAGVNSRLHELEVTDYPEIFLNGEE